MKKKEVATMEVGVKQLRNELSRWLGKVKEGNVVIVTDRGKAVARLSPASESSRFDELVAEGKIHPPTKPRGTYLKLGAPIKVKGGISDLLRDQKR